MGKLCEGVSVPVPSTKQELLDVCGYRAKIERIHVFAFIGVCAKIVVVAKVGHFVVRTVFAHSVQGDHIISASVPKRDHVRSTDDQSEHVVHDDEFHERENLGERRHIGRTGNHGIAHQNHDDVEKKQRPNSKEVKFVVTSPNAIRKPN